jgi:hypothetical protein
MANRELSPRVEGSLLLELEERILNKESMNCEGTWIKTVSN